MLKLNKLEILIIVVTTVFILTLPTSLGLSRCQPRPPEETPSGIREGECATAVVVYKATGCEKIEAGTCEKRCCKRSEESCCESHPDDPEICLEYCCIAKCWSCSASRRWTEYYGEDECGGTIYTRECWSFRELGNSESSCGMGNCDNEKVCVECDEWEACKECESWQQPKRYVDYLELDFCSPAYLISTMKPWCKCDGDCFNLTTEPRYYSYPIYPINECDPETEHQMSSDNVLLPVKIDWNNLTGHQEGWGTNQPCQQVLECPGSHACHNAPTDEDFSLKVARLRKCKKDCKTNCYSEELINLTSNENTWRLAPYKIIPAYTSCILECEKECRENEEYQTYADGCSGLQCPIIDLAEERIETIDYCYLQPYGYGHSYEIKISGANDKPNGIRDCSALKKIDELEQLIEEEKRQESADWRKIEGWEQEIINIRVGTHPIYQLEKNVYNAILEKSEFVAPCSCMLKASWTYDLQIRVCCPPKELMEEKFTSKEERDQLCGEWSTWNFTTTSPEPKLPYDPDWTGPEKTESISREQSREVHWCEIDNPDYYRETTIMLPPRGDIKYIYSPLSYLLQFYYFDEDKNKICHHFLDAEKNECDPEIFSPSFHEKIPPNKFSEEGFFTKETHYAWQVAACRERGGGGGCTDYGQLWEFSTRGWDLDIVLPHPPDNPDRPIGLPTTLSWSGADANSFKYELYEEGTLIKKDWVGTSSLPLDYNDPLKLDTVYSWKIQPCWDTEAEKCEEGVWFGPWQFRTTGQPPELYNPIGDDVAIPVNFKWERVLGARSYIFKVGEIEKITDRLEWKIGYPDLELDTTYSWEVFTCADTAAEVCHNQPATATFTTFNLKEPSDPTPSPGERIHARKVSWEEVEGAKFYQYQVRFLTLLEEEKRKDCENLEPNSIIIEGGTSKPPANLPLKCWGEYEWRVRACLDNTCGEGGRTDYGDDWWSFEFIAEFLPEDAGPGLIPCNQDFYNPDTLWDETDPCGIEHLFIIIHILVKFLVVRILPMILVLLALASGIIFYFSIKMEAPNPVAKVKSLWKAASIGIGLLLFAWIITSLLLNLFGYQLGPWHMLG